MRSGAHEATSGSRPAAIAVAIAALALVLAGCAAPAPGGSTRTWVIPAGAHEAIGAGVAVRTSGVLTFRARFDGSAEYRTADPANQLDINKLRGFSDCGEFHQVASARFGWRWADDRIEIHAYTYVRGERQSALLGSVLPGEWHPYRLEVTASAYLFSLDGVVTAMPRGCSSSNLTRYELWPYFGGDEVAPHTISIELDERS